MKNVTVLFGSALTSNLQEPDYTARCGSCNGEVGVRSRPSRHSSPAETRSESGGSPSLALCRPLQAGHSSCQNQSTSSAALGARRRPADSSPGIGCLPRTHDVHRPRSWLRPALPGTAQAVDWRPWAGPQEKHVRGPLRQLGRASIILLLTAKVPPGSLTSICVEAGPSSGPTPGSCNTYRSWIRAGRYESITRPRTIPVDFCTSSSKEAWPNVVAYAGANAATPHTNRDRRIITSDSACQARESVKKTKHYQPGTALLCSMDTDPGPTP